MTAYYVRSSAAGAGTGADWANAFTTLTAAFSGHAAGDIYYVAEDHSEATSSLSLSSNGTAAAPTYVICVDHLGSVPPVSADLRATSQIATTGNGTLRTSQSTVYIGIIFVAGDSTGSPSLIPVGSGMVVRFINCSLRIGSTGASGIIDLSNANTATGNLAILENTTVSFAATGQSINVGCTLVWKDTPSALLGTIPTSLFKETVRGGIVKCHGVDLSAAGSGKTLVAANVSSPAPTSFEFTDCKIDASVTLSATPTSQGAFSVDAVRVGSSGVNYKQTHVRYAGTLVDETTIVRTGGASDGTTALAWNITTTANAHWAAPFEAPPIAIWNDTTGSAVTATLQGIWGGGAVPNDDEIWLEVEYLGDASSPQASFVNDSKADVLASAAGQTAGTGTWGGSTTKFELAVSFTPQQKGWILARVKAAKASSTFYVDPKIALS